MNILNSHKLTEMINNGNFPLLKSIPTSYESNLYSLKKLGTRYGGWYIPVNKIEKDSICYCVGAGEDISFDIELVANFGCNIFIFDPTQRAKYHFDYVKNCMYKNIRAEINPPLKSKTKDFYTLLDRDKFDKLVFSTYGIWSESGIKRFYVPINSNYVSHSITNIQQTKEYFEAKCITIKEIMQQLGHDRLEILKLDIEGAEYDVIDSILSNGIKIKILCIEFDNLHRPQNNNFLNIGESYIAKLIKAGFKPIFRSWTDFTFINEN